MALNVTQRWLTIWLSSIGAFTLFVVVAVICMFPNLMDAGLVGMVINYSMMASGTLQGFIDSFSQLELQMNSVERVKEYSTMQVEAAYDQEMEREEGGSKQLVETPRGWPSEGRIEFKGVTARYRPELDRVLIDLNLEVKPREKVGIVGRTGSGKSTLVQLLFRILELEEGSIHIDGIDIFKMGLKSLRTAIAMLPQVRRNCIVHYALHDARPSDLFRCPPIFPIVLAPRCLGDSYWICDNSYFTTLRDAGPCAVQWNSAYESRSVR